jgi:aminopeptidase N
VKAGSAPGPGGLAPAADALAGVLRSFLGAPALADPAFAAQVLRLPAATDIAREIGRDIDPDAVHGACRGLAAALGQRLAEPLAALRETLATRAPYSPDAASAGRRALRNEALALIALGDPSRGMAMAVRQYDEADNLTDRLAALAATSSAPGPARDALFERFAAHYAAEPLVLDKWLLAQALLPESETLDRVRALMAHPAFSMTNPNRVRALIGGFAGNLTQFNRPDGAGYLFIADMVIALDRTNPQVASRLLGSFKSWRMLEPVRRALAEAALRGVSDTPGLSRDVSDIAARALA